MVLGLASEMWYRTFGPLDIAPYERITMEQGRQECATDSSEWLYAGQQDVSTTGIFEARESAVRSYCRTWPKVFDRATGSWMYDEDGRAYLDFFTGASALNYGHNNPVLKQALLDYVARDGVVHSLDMHTVAKRDFLTAFDELILQPRQLDYRVQFPGPGGTNAVEAALKVARKATGRTEVVAFTGAFHGMTLGALAVTGSKYHRGGAGVPLPHVIQVPFGCPSTATGWHARDRAPAAGQQRQPGRRGSRDRGNRAGGRRDQRGPAGMARGTGRHVPAPRRRVHHR